MGYKVGSTRKVSVNRVNTLNIPTIISRPKINTFTITPSVSGNSTWDLTANGSLSLTTAGTWTIVPPETGIIAFKMWGGGGGRGSPVGANGGGGAYAGGHMTLIANQPYTLIVGGRGITSGPTRGAAWGGGGSGGGGALFGGGGGGATAIYQGANTFANVSVIAAGGGGSGANDGGSQSAGGGGGVAGGEPGINMPGSPGTQGNGGTTSAGGGGGTTNAQNSATAGTPGSALNGGEGGARGGSGAAGGGGGGGYYGGGGGGGQGSQPSYGGGGGGGSSYYNPAVLPEGLTITLLGANGYVAGNFSDPDRGTSGAGGITGSLNGNIGKLLLYYTTV